MNKLRLIILCLTFFVVFLFGTIIFLYARGYRLNPSNRQITPNGLLVIKSHPDGAQIFINGQLKTATNATIPLNPNIYDISVKKEGFLEWKKRLTIDKEVVTEGTAHLFKSAPSLSAVTFSGASTPVISPDLGKLSYAVPTSSDNQLVQGLWIIENINLPIGFTREPRRITDADLSAQSGLTNSNWIWSPSGKQILIFSPKGTYLLDTSVFTSQSKLVNISSTVTDILDSWHSEQEDKLAAQMRKLPDQMQEVLSSKVKAISFSPDEDMVVYTASSSATIPEKLILELPGSSTQHQERAIKEDQTYVYDIKEDRNFLITDQSVNIFGWVNYESFKDSVTEPASKKPSSTPIPTTANQLQTTSLSWYPSSRHLISASIDKIIIMDYDGTNRQTVYSGSYIAPAAFPTLSLDRLLILTNLGGTASLANLYSLGIK